MRTRASFLKNALKWLILFTVLVIAPLVFAAIGHPEESRGFWIEFGVALGFIGLAMMGLQFVLTARYSKIGAPFGLDELLQFHGKAGYFGWGFIMGHFIILFLADSDFHAFLDPTVNLPRAFALGGVIIALTALIATTHWREKFGIVYEWWRASHGLLALFVVFVGTVHILQVSYYVTEWWQITLWVGMSVAAISMLVHNRVWRPYMMKKKPYTVTEINREVDTVWSITLEPEGHKGMEFAAGQFVWITLGDSPFKLQQHPFTISSAPEEMNRIRLTIKQLGDFTSKIKEIKEGSTAFMEGPYGNFTISDDPETHNIFISGGIGITPVMSILKSLEARDGQRKTTLVYGTPSKEQTPFYDELQKLSDSINLKIIHVFENAPEGWEGETGFITDELLHRHLPENFDDCEYFVCGPPPMMDVTEESLKNWGIPVYKIHSERFNIV
jgi:predicted ferric reductase